MISYTYKTTKIRITRRVRLTIVAVGKYVFWVCVFSLRYRECNAHALYRVIHKSLRNFRTRLLNNQDRHGRKEHINRYRISQSFFFVLGALAYLQVPPLGGSRDEKWRAQ